MATTLFFETGFFFETDDFFFEAGFVPAAVFFFVAAFWVEAFFEVPFFPDAPADLPAFLAAVFLDAAFLVDGFLVDGFLAEVFFVETFLEAFVFGERLVTFFRLATVERLAEVFFREVFPAVFLVLPVFLLFLAAAFLAGISTRLQEELHETGDYTYGGRLRKCQITPPGGGGITPALQPESRCSTTTLV